MANQLSNSKPLIVTMFSPRNEFHYRFHEALLNIPNIKKRYRFINLDYHSNDEPVPSIHPFQVSGIITSISTGLVDATPFVDFGVPVVNISLSSHEKLMSLFVDPASLSEKIVRHALGAQFKKIIHLTTPGLKGQIEQQGASLKLQAEASDLEYTHYTTTRFPQGMIHSTWMEENKLFLSALTKEKKRTLYFTGYDNTALSLLHLMNHLGMKAPQDAGILGRGDTTSSKLTDPGISTVKWPFLGLANTAIEMLEKKRGDRRIPSGEVVIRESSVKASQSDNQQWILKIADLIESYGHEGLSVDQLAQHAKVSKSTLERHYQKIHGVTPTTALRNVQLKKAEQLLRTSDMTMEGIAYSAGFKSVRTFFRAFESVYKTSPATWRNRRL